MEDKEEGKSDNHPSHRGRSIESAIASWRGTEFSEGSKTVESTRVSSTHSSKSQWSHHSPESEISRSTPSDVEHEANDFQDESDTSEEASIRSYSRRSISRDGNTREQGYRMKKHEKINPDAETDFSNSDQDNHRSHARSSTNGVNDENGEETIHETSLDETSFNTTLYSDKGNGSSSELSIDPVVWKKFKFLSSILKETQHNLRAMDDLILEHRRLQDLTNLQAEQSRASTVASRLSIVTSQGFGDGEPKTDEAKLEEILSLLHNLTQTLSSYEQHPLLASTLRPARSETAHLSDDAHHHHVQQTPHWYENMNKGHSSNIPDTRDHHSGHAPHAPGSYQPSHQPSQQPPLWQGNLSLDGKPADKVVGGYDIAVSSPSTDAVNRNISTFTDGAFQSSHTVHDHLGLLGVKHEDVRSAYPTISPHYSVTESIDKTASINDVHLMTSDTSQYSRLFTKDSISQTDCIPIVSHVTAEYPVSSHTSVFHFQNGLHSDRPEGLQNQDHPHHPLMKETRSLRKDIDDIMVRKQALDSRLQSLIAHRATQKEMELIELENSKRKQTRLIRSRSLEEVDNKKLRARIKKYKSRSKSYEEETNHQRKAGTTARETYLCMINEDQDEFPSLTMESLENDEKISELKSDEADLPGLGDSGLSSEINSISATIQELIKENQQLHKFLQGMTCESILKVDQEKLVLEAKIKSLNEENQSLKKNLNEDSVTETADVAKHASKAVTFFLAQTSEEEQEETESRKNITKTRKVKNEDDKHMKKGLTVTSVDQSLDTTEDEMYSLNKEEVSGCAKTQTSVWDDSQNSSKVDIGQLKTIEEERKMDEGRNQVPEKLQSQREVERDAKETRVTLKDDIFVEDSDAARELKKLTDDVKKLREENEELNFKLSEEVSKRDLEGAKLEAQIRILSERNQQYARKLDVAENKSKTDKVNKTCQTESLNHQVNYVIPGSDDDSITTVIDRSEDCSSILNQTAAGVTPSITDVRKPDSAGGTVKNIPVSTHDKTSIASANDTSPISIADAAVIVLSENVTSEDNVTVKGLADAKTETNASTNVLSCISNSGSIENANKMASRIADHIANESNDSISSIVHSSRLSETAENSEVINVLNSDRHEKSLDVYNVFGDQAVKSPVSDKGDIVISSRNMNNDKDNVIDPNITYVDNQHSGIEDTKLIPQLEELLRQNEVIASGLNDLKSSAMTSETYLECTMMKIMEKYGKIIQNIDERLRSGQSSDRSEFESKLIHLAKENQELTSTLEQQHKKIDLLTNKNSSLEKKLHLALGEGKEICSTGTEVEKSDVTPLTLHRAAGGDDCTIREAETDQEMKDTCTEGNKIAALSTFPDEETSPDSEHLVAKYKNLTDVDVTKPMTTNAAGDGSEPSQMRKDSPRLSLTQMKEDGKGSSTHIRSPDSPDSRSQETSIQQGGSGHQLSSRKSSLCSIEEAAEDKNPEAEETEIVGRGLGSEGLPNLTLRREKENWTQMLEQAEKEKQILQDRIITLVNENDYLVARLEEVVGVSRNLSGQMHSAKDQLVKVTAEKDDLQKKVRSLEDGKDECSLSLSDSVGSSRLTQQLRERIRSLQSEVEQAWQEVHQRTMEKDKISAEKESLEYTSSINLRTAKKENETQKSQITALQEDKDKLSVELTNLQNALERKSADVRATKDNHANQWERLMDAERRADHLQNELREKQEQLQNEKEERKNAETQLEEIKKQKLSSTSHVGSSAGSEPIHTRGERHWLETITRLKGQLHQEQLRSRLLEAAEQESSTRILILQRSIRETIEAHETLQAKYNQLRVAYRAKKAEKIHHRELSQQYTAQVKELGKTSAALEENLKIMLSALGENIDVAVGILTSHVFLSPCVVHPSPDLHLDPEAWFGAQQARLRWLQTQLRKLCLHSWKTADLPRTSNLGSILMEQSTVDQPSQFSNTTAKTPTYHKDMRHKEGSGLEQTPKTCMKKNDLSELSILDESRSYTSTPVKKKKNVSAVSFHTASSSCDSPRTEKDSESGNLHTGLDSRVGHVGDPSYTSSKATHVTVSYNPNITQFSNSSKNLNEAERILTSRQRELSEARYRQYKALINKLQRDLEYTLVYSPSVPSSMITTPERMLDYCHNLEESECNSTGPEGSTSEVQDSQASSPRTLASQSGTEDSITTQSPSLKDKDLPAVLEETSEVQELENVDLSSDTRLSSEDRDLPSHIKDDSDQTCNSLSQQELPREEADESKRESKLKDFLKEDRSSHGLDSDKDRDSLEGEDEEDFIRLLVESEDVDERDMD